MDFVKENLYMSTVSSKTKFALGCLLSIVLLILGGQFITRIQPGEPLAILAISIAFFGSSLFLFHRHPAEKRMLLQAILIGLIGCDILVRFLEDWWIYTVPRLVFEVTAVLIAYGWATKWRAAPAKGVGICALFVGGWALYSRYINDPLGHYSNFDNFYGTVSEDRPSIALEDKNKNVRIETDYRGKVVLFDFWGSFCGVCFQKFPALQNLHDKYAAHPSVIIQAVNIPVEGDTVGQAFAMIEEKGYTFPVVVGKHGETDVQFGLNVYPTVIIWQDNRIFYRGDIEGAEAAIEKALSTK